MKLDTGRESGIASARGAWMAATHIPGMPRPTFEAPGETGSGETPEQIAAREAAAKAAADKAAADKAAADKVAADKAEADRKAAEEAELKKKGATDKELELYQEIQVRKRKEREAKTELEKATTRLKEFEGIDPAKVKELIAAQEKAAEAAKKVEQENLEKKGEWDRLKQMMADQHKSETESLKTQVETGKTALQAAQETIANLTIGSSFANSTFVSDETVLTPDLARQAFGSHFDTNADGTIVAYDKPKGTKERTMLVDGSGSPLKFEDSIKKLIEGRPDKDKLMRAKLANGAGSRTENVRTITTTTQQQQTGPRGVSRIAAALAKGSLKAE